MMPLENRIQIEAPPSVVWRVTTDIENWPQWTPTITSVKRVDGGPLTAGSVAQIKQPGLPLADWTVTELAEGKRFVWESRVRGIRMKATHEMAASDVGTINTLRLELSGAMVLLLWPLIRRSARSTLDRENAGLKSACENLALRDEQPSDRDDRR